MSEEIQRQVLPLFARPIYIVKGYNLSKEEIEAVQLERNQTNDNAGKNYTSKDSYIFNKPAFKNLSEWIIKVHNYDFLNPG